MKALRFLLLPLLLLCAASSYAWDTTQNPNLFTASSVSSGQVMWPGGIGVFAVVGTWNGATVTLQFVGPDGATLVTAGTATTFTANGASVFYLPRCLIQATITAAGGSTSLSASAAIVP